MFINIFGETEYYIHRGVLMHDGYTRIYDLFENGKKNLKDILKTLS